MSSDQDRAVRELLAFYMEAGVDVAINDAAVDRFAEPAAAPLAAASPSVARPAAAATARPSTAAPREDRENRPSPLTTASLRPPEPAPARQFFQTAPPAPEAAVMAAREAARNAASLDELRAILDRFEGCALRVTASRLCFADGDARGRVMFVGEAPGRDEDIAGLPFVGRSGQLLDRMMAAIGLDRTSAYIANIVPWRPPGNRTPTPQESAICLPFLLRQIELADPDVLVCLGGPSAQTLLNTRDGILKTRGRWFAFHTGSRAIRAIATLHPAYLLRQPVQKRLAWRDFLAIKKALAG